jgi:hypothetical protein
MQAYILVQTETREPIAPALLAIDGIDVAVDLTGPYDALAKVDGTGRPVATIEEEVRALPNVLRAIVAPVEGIHSSASVAAA